MFSPLKMYSNRISVIDVPEKNGKEKNNTTRMQDAKGADFDTAVLAAECGRFHYLLFLALIPISWASSLDTANMSMILPSAECDLQLTIFHKGILNAVVYVGMVSSGFMWGYLADVRGRKSIIIYGYLADGICNFAAGFTQDFWTLVFFKFLSGFAVSGPYATLMTYCSEFYATKDRARIPLVVGFSVAFGCVVNAALAWLVIPQEWSIVLWDGAFEYNSWRIFLSLCGVPTLIGVLCLCMFPESPKFLMSQGRNEDALRVFKLMYRLNTGKPADTYPIKVLREETMADTSIELPSGKRKKLGFQDGLKQMKPIFFNPHLPRLLLVITMQFGGMLAMNTLRLWQPQLFAILNNFNSFDYNSTNGEPTFCEILDYSTMVSANQSAAHATAQITSCTNTVVPDSVYVDTIIVSATSNLFILIAGVLVNVLRHKKLLLISYGASLLCVVSMNWSTSSMLTLTLTCLFIGLLNTTLNIVIGATVLLFPTSLRTMAVSLEMMVGRIGSMIGNLLFPILLSTGCLSPIIALAAFVSLCIVLTCFLPNTRNSEN